VSDDVRKRNVSVSHRPLLNIPRLRPRISLSETLYSKLLSAAITAAWMLSSGTALAAADVVTAVTPRSIGELKPTATLHLGKTADWVTITSDAVWVGSTGPFAVHRIDPKTNNLVATVELRGEPCAGLATGFGSLWVPLCGDSPMLARIDLESNKLVTLLDIGPAAAEGGVAASSDSVWLVVDKNGSLARIDPATGKVRQTIRLPAGSYNPFYSDGRIWVTRADGAELTSVDAATGAVLATTRTGPGPRFLTAGSGAVCLSIIGIIFALARVPIGPPYCPTLIAASTSA